MKDYIFITTCSKTKKKVEAHEELPLSELYTGKYHSIRTQFIKLFGEDYYYVTPSGPGIIHKDFVYHDYNIITPNHRLRDPDFIKHHRQLFEERYPDVMKSIKKIYWLGAAKYDKFLESVFYDKEIIYILNKDEKQCRIGEISSIFGNIILSNNERDIEYKISKQMTIDNNIFINGKTICRYDDSIASMGNSFILKCNPESDSAFIPITPAVSHLKQYLAVHDIDMKKKIEECGTKSDMFNYSNSIISAIFDMMVRWYGYEWDKIKINCGSVINIPIRLNYINKRFMEDFPSKFKPTLHIVIK